MKTILITDKSEVASQTKQAEDAATMFQQVLDEFKGMNLFELQTISDLEQLVRRGEEFIRVKIEEGLETQEVRVFGIKLRTSRKKMVDLIDLPSFDSLNCIIPDAKIHLNQIRHMDIEGSKVVVSAVGRKNIQDQCSVIAYTDEGVKLYKEHEAAVSALNEIQKLRTKLGLGTIISTDSFSCMFFIESSGQVKINDTFYKDNRHAFGRE